MKKELSLDSQWRNLLSREIERKYLLSSLPAYLKEGTPICQAYLLTGETEIRIRQKADKYFLTMKKGEGFNRFENETQLSKEAFDILLCLGGERVVRKTRFLMPSKNDLTWEIDEYHGDLQGLFTAEIELPDECSNFDVPEELSGVIVKEITFDERFKNQNLASTKAIPII